MRETDYKPEQITMLLASHDQADTPLQVDAHQELYRTHLSTVRARAALRPEPLPPLAEVRDLSY